MGLYILFGILIILFIYILVMYNQIIKAKLTVDEAFSTMDVYLKRRWDLIPNLVETVKAYAKHEKNIFESITELRDKSYSSLSSNDKIDINKKMENGLSKVLILSENYPELKANENYLQLSKDLVETEDLIADSRKYYNAVVKNYNIKIQIFPNNLIANVFKFKGKEMFEAINDERENIKVDKI
mgnify:FL=1